MISIDLLVLDQLLSNYLLPHKEYFMSDFVTVLNPFLDNDVLDFVMKTPYTLRLKRRLFKETVSEMFPQLFAVKRATQDEFNTDWGKEFSRHQKEIELLLLSQSSILDKFIPPEKIVEFMRNGLSSKTSVTTKTCSKLKSTGFRIVNAFGKYTGTPSRPRTYEISRAELLRRILVIRSFLNKTVDRQENNI